MAYFFDGAVIMILIVTALTGYCKGFVRYVITMLGTVAAVLVAFLIANMSAENVYNKYFKTQLITSLENAAEQTDLSKLVSNELKNEGVDIDLSDEEIKKRPVRGQALLRRIPKSCLFQREQTLIPLSKRARSFQSISTALCPKSSAKSWRTISLEKVCLRR